MGTVVRRKRFLWHPDDIEKHYSDDFFSEDEQPATGRPKPISMARMMDLSMSEYELMRFYSSDSTPLLEAATGDDRRYHSRWINSIITLAASNDALKQTCMGFATLHLGHSRSKSTYTLKNGFRHPKSCGAPDMSLVSGYTKLEDKVLERVLQIYLAAIRGHNKQIVNMTSETYESVLLSGVMIYLLSMSLGSMVPVFDFEDGADLMSIGRSIAAIHSCYSNLLYPIKFPMALNTDCRLPREGNYWEIIDFVDEDGDYPEEEKARVKQVLTAELKNMKMLFSMDLELKSVTCLASWSVYWTPGFFQLLREEHNTYALLFLAQWCSYGHMWHVLFWWKDRVKDDLLYLKAHLPERVHQFFDGPLEVCSRFDVDYFGYFTEQY